MSRMLEALSTWEWSIDGWIVLAGVLCGVAAALPGCFLVLRRMSLMGDAISHSVLPGLAVAFILTGSRASLPMFIGAAIVGVLTAVAIDWVSRIGKVDEGASMGVVFTTLFALGLVLIVKAADYVDLDPSCVLYGAIELTPLDTVSIFGLDIPRVVPVLGTVLLINTLFIILFYKELKISSFDPALATSVGISARVMNYALMSLVAITVVAAFESVGNILVVAMLVVPGAAAHTLTDRLWVMLVIASVIGALSAILGHLSAIALPPLFGFESTNTVGMMALSAGMILLLAILFGPRYGLLSRARHRRKLSLSIAAEDVLGLLVRAEESQMPSLPATGIRTELHLSSAEMRGVVRQLVTEGKITRTPTTLSLLPAGRASAQNLLRSHRLWESYLAHELGVRPDHVHASAERLEHITSVQMRQELATSAPEGLDPHGKQVPGEQANHP